MHNQSNMPTAELSADVFKKVIDDFPGRYEKYIERQMEEAKRQTEIVDFCNWLEGSCKDEEIMAIGLMSISCVPLPPFLYGKIKPWIDRYEQETSTK